MMADKIGEVRFDLQGLIVRDILEDITANPKNLYSASWHENYAFDDGYRKITKLGFQNSCGTVHCLAGHAQVKAIKYDSFENIPCFAYMAGKKYLPSFGHVFLHYDLTAQDVMEMLRDWLEVNEPELLS